MSDANPKGTTDEDTDAEPLWNDDDDTTDDDGGYEIEDTADTSTATDPGRNAEPKRVELQFPGGREFGVYRHLRHRSDDQTIVFLGSFGGGYQAWAIDINAAGEILETEVIGHASDEGRAAGMCEYWLDANPKGILGDSVDPTGGGGGGALSNLKQMFGGN